jgi:hypothetical protein
MLGWLFGRNGICCVHRATGKEFDVTRRPSHDRPTAERKDVNLATPRDLVSPAKRAPARIHPFKPVRQHQQRKNMSKTRDSKKQTKKAPMRSLKEKRAEKRAKKKS